MKQGFAPDVADRAQDAVQLHGVERVPSLLEALDIVELAGDVQLGPAVPELPVGADERGSAFGRGRGVGRGGLVPGGAC